MAKKEQHFDSTRAIIRSTATKLFREGGIHSSSLADIAKAAKISKGTLYYHYPSKEYLVADIADAHLTRMTEQLFTWISTLSGDQPVKEAIGALTRLLLADEDELRLRFILLSEAMGGNDALLSRFRTKTREWCVMLEVASLKVSNQRADTFREMSPAYFALLDGYALHFLLKSPVPEDALSMLFL